VPAARGPTWLARSVGVPQFLIRSVVLTVNPLLVGCSISVISVNGWHELFESHIATGVTCVYVAQRTALCATHHEHLLQLPSQMQIQLFAIVLSNMARLGILPTT
jgi:hypothetical protein